MSFSSIDSDFNFSSFAFKCYISWSQQLLSLIALNKLMLSLSVKLHVIMRKPWQQVSQYCFLVYTNVAVIFILFCDTWDNQRHIVCIWNVIFMRIIKWVVITSHQILTLILVSISMIHLSKLRRKSKYWWRKMILMIHTNVNCFVCVRLTHTSVQIFQTKPSRPWQYKDT